MSELVGRPRSMNPEAGPEEALLRKIVNGRSPGYIGSILDEFEREHGWDEPMTAQRGRPLPRRPVLGLADALGRKGLITVQYPAGFGPPGVEATDAGRQWVRSNPA